MDLDDIPELDSESIEDTEDKGPGHEYPTYEHRQSDFEGKMEPRPLTENELKFLRHLSRRLNLRAGIFVF